MQHNSSSNPAVATVAGVVLLGLVAGAVWLLILLLESGVAAMGDSIKYFLGTPIVLILAYLVGNGWMELRTAGRK